MLPATQEMLEDEDADREEEQVVEEIFEEQKPPPKPMSLFALLKKKLFAREPDAEPVPAAAPPPPHHNPHHHSGAGHPQNRRPQRRPQQPRRKPKATYTVEDIPNLFKVNSDVLVQVTKGPIGTKGPRVTTNLSIPGRYLVLLPNSSHLGVSKRIESHEERDRLRRILRALPIPANMGVICRTVGANKSEKAFQKDLRNLLTVWKQAEDTMRSKRAPCCVYQEPALVERTIRDYLTEEVDEIVTDHKPTHDQIQEFITRFAADEPLKLRYYNNPKPLFHKYALTEQIEAIFSRRVPLATGSSIVVDETEALIAIDVNSGRNRAGKDHPETILNTNLEAVAEVARQLRLRNVGGLIVIDFIDMRSRKDQQTVYRALKDALLNDRARTKVLPISILGLVEMTRQRETESLQDAMYSPCPYCEGKGLVKSTASVSVEIQRRLQEVLKRYRGGMSIRILVHPNILERLKKEDSDLIKAMEEEFRCQFAFESDRTLHLEEFRIREANSGDEL
jgi:ribonuclease G